MVLGDYTHISEGAQVKTTNRILEVPVGEGLLGRVVDSLGTPLDGKGAVSSDQTAPIEKVAPGVISRQSVDQPVQTGLKSIDAMVPIGRGQRELIIGDRQTGKTAVAVDTIINQKGTGIKCIYVAVGQKNSSVANVVKKLEEEGALEHTIIVNAAASDSAAMQYIAPYSGCAMAQPEYGAIYCMAAESDAAALTMIVCSNAPSSSNFLTTLATEEFFWPTAT